MCGITFWSESPKSLYCCENHKQKAYRWRTKVTKQKLRAIDAVNQLAVYLNYEITTPRATLALSDIRAHIADALLSAKVQVVK